MGAYIEGDFKGVHCSLEQASAVSPKVKAYLQKLRTIRPFVTREEALKINQYVREYLLAQEEIKVKQVRATNTPAAIPKTHSSSNSQYAIHNKKQANQIRKESCAEYDRGFWYATEHSPAEGSEYWVTQALVRALYSQIKEGVSVEMTTYLLMETAPFNKLPSAEAKNAVAEYAVWKENPQLADLTLVREYISVFIIMLRKKGLYDKGYLKQFAWLELENEEINDYNRVAAPQDDFSRKMNKAIIIIQSLKSCTSQLAVKIVASNIEKTKRKLIEKGFPEKKAYNKSCDLTFNKIQKLSEDNVLPIAQKGGKS